MNSEKSSAPPQLSSAWSALLGEEFDKPYMKELKEFVAKERKSGEEIYPPPGEVFSAFSYRAPEEIKVVIVGQDPYHGKGQAHGLSFSVKPGIAIPPSLQNIYKELESDLGIKPPNHGTLIHWAEQGVLLLNATLTVRQKTPLSHHGRGWETFTDAVIAKLAKLPQPLVFFLWGKSAQAKVEQLHLAGSRHLILKAPHPSPFSAYTGFFGSRPFSKANQFLIKQGLTPINWALS